MTMLSTDITRAPYNKKRMVYYKVVIGQDISIQDIIISLIKSQSRRYLWNSVPTWTYLGIISRRHYMDINSVAFVMSLLVSMKMTFPLKMHPEENCLKRER